MYEYSSEDSFVLSMYALSIKLSMHFLIIGTDGENLRSRVGNRVMGSNMCIPGFWLGEDFLNEQVVLQDFAALHDSNYCSLK